MKRAIRKYLGGDETQCTEMKRGGEGDHTTGEGWKKNTPSPEFAKGRSWECLV